MCIRSANLGNDTGFCPENKGSQASTLGFIFSGTLEFYLSVAHYFVLNWYENIISINSVLQPSLIKLILIIKKILVTYKVKFMCTGLCPLGAQYSGL